MDTELLGIIISSVVTAFVTLSVCLINNHYARKSEETTRLNEREENERKRKEELENMEIKRKNDSEEQLKRVLEDVKSNSEAMKDYYSKEITDVKHTLDTQNKIFNLQLSTLTEEVRKHNNFALRVPALEAKVEMLTKAKDEQ